MTAPPVALVLPGRGYGHDHPGLYYTRMALASRGWRAHLVTWEGLPEDPALWPDHVSRVAASAIEEVRPELLVGKSLGSFAMPLAVERGVPGIWLTPLLTDERLAVAAAHLPARSLLVGGTADGSWDGGLARAGAASCGCEVLELDGADHCFDIRQDPRGSIAALDRLATAVIAVLDRLGPSGEVHRTASIPPRSANSR